jgi:hypothetical protein
VEKWNADLDAKSDVMGFRSKNYQPLSTIAHVIRAHTSLVYPFLDGEALLAVKDAVDFLKAPFSNRSVPQKLPIGGRSLFRC